MVQQSSATTAESSGGGGPESAFKAAMEERIGAAKSACVKGAGELASCLVVTSRRVCCLEWARNPVEVCLDLLSQVPVWAAVPEPVLF